MSQHHLPAGCHDAETAAQLLNMSKRALLKKMRELGWLNVGGGEGNHNLPRREFTKNGFLCTQDRGYCLKGKKEISKSYRVMLLTQTGFNALKHELEKMKTNTQTKKEQTTAVVAHLPKPHQMHQVAPQEPDAPFDREAAEKERDEALKHMREWGLAS
jgi:hypothetical protein